MDNQAQTPRPAPADPMRGGNSDVFTRRYLDSLLIEMRLIDSGLASTRMELFGHSFETPVMLGVMGMYSKLGEDALRKEAQAAAEVGAVLWVSSHLSAEELKMCIDTGAKVIQVIKPYADLDKFIADAQTARDLGCIAVATDIDHAYSKDGGYDSQKGEAFAPRTAKDLARIVSALRIPFLAKGVLSVADAVKCREAGVAGILLSHHHNIMPFAVPPLMLLPEIRKAVGEDYPIFVDCGIDTGADAFKALALGADGVCTARAAMRRLAGGKDELAAFLRETTGELRHFMNRTASPDVRYIDPAVIHPFAL